MLMNLSLLSEGRVRFFWAVSRSYNVHLLLVCQLVQRPSYQKHRALLAGWGDGRVICIPVSGTRFFRLANHIKYPNRSLRTPSTIDTDNWGHYRQHLTTDHSPILCNEIHRQKVHPTYAYSSFFSLFYIAYTDTETNFLIYIINESSLMQSRFDLY